MKRRFDPNKLIPRFRNFTLGLVSISFISAYLAYESYKDSYSIAEDLQSIATLNEKVEKRKTSLLESVKSLPPIVSEPLEIVSVSDIRGNIFRSDSIEEATYYYSSKTECFVLVADSTNHVGFSVEDNTFNEELNYQPLNSNNEIIPSYEISFEDIQFGEKFLELSVEQATERYNQLSISYIHLSKLYIDLDKIVKDKITSHFKLQECKQNQTVADSAVTNIPVRFIYNPKDKNHAGFITGFDRAATETTLGLIMDLPATITQKARKGFLEEEGEILSLRTYKRSLGLLYEENKKNFDYPLDRLFPKIFFQSETFSSDVLLDFNEIGYAYTFEEQFPGIIKINNQLKTEFDAGSLTLAQLKKVTELLESNKVREAAVLGIKVNVKTVSTFYWIFLTIFFGLYLANIIFFWSLVSKTKDKVIEEPWMGIASHPVAMTYIVILFVVIPGSVSYYLSMNATDNGTSALLQYVWLLLVIAIATIKWRLISTLNSHENAP